MKKFVFWGLIILALIVGVGIVQYVRSSQEASQAEAAQKAAAVQKYKYELAEDESTQKDSLAASAVNRERLSAVLQKYTDRPVDTTELDAQINSIMSANTDITFGITIKDLNTDAVHDYGNTGPMTAASVSKVLTAVDYYKQVELGHKSLTTVMSNGLTAEQNIEQMIVVSDNDSWHLLNNSLTYSQMESYAHSIGLTSYNYEDNTISAHDIAMLCGDVYARKLIDETHTQTLLSYMERANYRDLIVPAVPTHDTIYHKAGWYLHYLNDTAIITNGDKTIVLTIFTDSHAAYNKSRIAGLMQQITTPTLVAFGLN